MGVYILTKKIAMPRECCGLPFALAQHVAPWCLHWPLAQLFSVVGAGSTDQCLSLSFLDIDAYDRRSLHTTWKHAHGGQCIFLMQWVNYGQKSVNNIGLHLNPKKHIRSVIYLDGTVS